MPPCLLFYPGSGLAGAVIRWWTRSPYAHVAPCIDGIVYDAFWGKRLTARPYDPARDDQALRRPVTPATEPAWLPAQLGKPYDWRAIWEAGLCKRGLMGQHVYDSLQGCWTCSRISCIWIGMELVAWGLKWPVTPGDLELMTRIIDVKLHN